MPINSFLYPGAKVVSAFEVSNSLRFNRGSSDYLNKTFSSAGSRTTWTISVWVKRANEHSTNSYIIDSGGGNGTSLYFGTEQIEFWDYQSGYTGRLTTNRRFRDMSAWYHIVAVWDTTNSTAGDRMRLYVNGVEETSFATDTNPSSSQNSILNDGSTSVTIGRQGSIYTNLYMAEFCYIDGQALDATSFGEFDSDTGIWKPIDVSGLTFGTNGFYLDFEDSSALGNDVSGNNNDFTVNNLTSIDQTTDTCTNNYATFNPLINNWTDVSEGNLKVKNTSQAYRDIFSTVALTSGKWYVECRIDTEAGGTYPIFGIADASDYSYPAQHNLLGRSTNGYGFQTDGNYYHNNADAGNWSTLDSGDIIGFYLDLDSATKTLKVYKNGTSELSININNPIDGYYFGCSTFQADNVSGSINFGNPSFTISSGNSDANGYGNFEYSPTISSVNYYAINTKNLAEYG